MFGRQVGGIGVTGLWDSGKLVLQRLGVQRSRCYRNMEFRASVLQECGVQRSRCYKNLGFKGAGAKTWSSGAWVLQGCGIQGC